VVLTATANAGYVFSSWSGGATGSSSSCTVTVTANMSVTANFVVNGSTPVALDNMVLYYKFDEGSGSTVFDSTGQTTAQFTEQHGQQMEKSEGHVILPPGAILMPEMVPASRSLATR